MTVTNWPMRMQIRAFEIVFVPDLDRKAESEIRLGLFGDLRMGDRYAIGLIARSKGDPEDVAKVGRLAAALVSEPYKALTSTYEAIWAAADRPAAFEGALNRPHSSLQFRHHDTSEVSAALLDSGLEAEHVREWCMDTLRAELRKLYGNWIPAPNRELFAEDAPLVLAA